MKTTVYRFECGTCHDGPYRCFCAHAAMQDLHDKLSMRHCGSPEHRTPCTHIIDYLWRGYRSAMEDLDMLFQWFDDLLPDLHRAGVVLAWYEIEKAEVIPLCHCEYATTHILYNPAALAVRNEMTIED